ncbi:unnamed protein product [Cuscuta europaea]|uniref:Uncharacterized protein n=2 Tax=Cuscuta europaea TaxID=41803 RepID=A0A9P0ZIR4_CUSEU|nr:unnamed protein product [Cuscuta europaea]
MEVMVNRDLLTCASHSRPHLLSAFSTRRRGSGCAPQNLIGSKVHMDETKCKGVDDQPHEGEDWFDACIDGKEGETPKNNPSENEKDTPGGTRGGESDSDGQGNSKEHGEGKEDDDDGNNEGHTHNNNDDKDDDEDSDEYLNNDSEDEEEEDVDDKDEDEDEVVYQNNQDGQDPETEKEDDEDEEAPQPPKKRKV